MAVIRFVTSPSAPYHGHVSAENNKSRVVDMAAHLLQTPGKVAFTPEAVDNDGLRWKLECGNDWKIMFGREHPSVFDLSYRYSSSRLSVLAAHLKECLSASFHSSSCFSLTCETRIGENRCGKETTHVYPAMGGGWHSMCEEHSEKHRDISSTVSNLIARGIPFQ